MIRKRFSHWKMICVTKKNGLKNYYRRLDYRTKKINKAVVEIVDLLKEGSYGGSMVPRPEPTTPRPPDPPGAQTLVEGPPIQLDIRFKDQDRY